MTRLLLVLVVACAIVGCDGASSAKKQHPPSSLKLDPARIETSLTLPSGDGRVHIIAVPTDYLEITRCVVAVGPNGSASVSCAPKGFDLPPTDE